MTPWVSTAPVMASIDAFAENESPEGSCVEVAGVVRLRRLVDREPNAFVDDGHGAVAE